MQPGLYLCSNLGHEGIPVVVICCCGVEDTLTIEIASAYIVVDFVVASADGHIVLSLGTSAAEHIAIPIEIAEIAPFAAFVFVNPRAVRMLRFVEAPVVEHLHLLIRIIPSIVALGGMFGEFVGQHHVVVSAGDEVGPGCIGCDSGASVVCHL